MTKEVGAPNNIQSSQLVEDSVLFERDRYGFDSTRFLTSLMILPDRVRGVVCDIGCGEGIFARLLNQRFPLIDRIILLDTSTVRLQRARGLCNIVTPQRFDYIVADVRYLPLKNACVNTCVLLEVIEHLAQSGGVKALKEAKRIMKDSGLILLSTPNRNSITSITGRLLSSVFDFVWTAGDPSHVHIYSISGILGLLKNEGLEILKKRGYYILPSGIHEIDRKFGNNNVYGLALSKMVFKSDLWIFSTHVLIFLCARANRESRIGGQEN